MPKSARVPGDCDLRCGDYVPFLEIPDNQGAEVTTLVRCTKCDLVFEHPRPPQEEIRAFYKDERLWTGSTDAEGNQRSYVREVMAKKPLFADLSARIEKHRSGGRLLDIGCGAGLLETVMDKNTWDVTGVESSEFIADFGRQHFGANIVSAKFEDLNFPEGHFDVVVLKYVLDHMEEPLDVLRKVRSVIKSDGLLVIADLINIESFCARFFAEGHRLIHPMHFTYFSPSTIATHLRRVGFEVVKIDYPFVRSPYCSVSNLTTFASRVIQRGFRKYVSKNRGKVYSTAFYGNMMDVWANPSALD